MKKEMSIYEKKKLKLIEQWKNPETSWLGEVWGIVTKPLDVAGELVMDAPGVGWVIEKTVSGLVGVLNDFAQWSVRQDAIIQEYRDGGHKNVNGHRDILKLDLEDVDSGIGYLAAKYKSLAAAEGAATGVVGLPGIPADVVALILLNLRAIGEYATYCGFDVSTQQERLFSMHVLGFASSPQDSTKVAAMAELVLIAKQVAKKAPWEQLSKHTLVKVIQQIAKALGIRLTKAKLAQAVPIVGSGIGAGFNAYFTSNVCEAAYYLYRERFLAAKYGAKIIAGKSARPSDFNKAYSERAEYA